MPQATDPTLRQIREMCEEIQAGWTADEKLQRAAGNTYEKHFHKRHWTPQTIESKHLEIDH